MIFESIFLSIDGTLTDTTTTGENGSGINSNEGTLHSPDLQTFTISLVSYPGHPLGGGSYFSAGYTVSIF